MKKRTRIKVCGITEISEAEEIALLGVDALGFIFVKDSPRKIEPEAAREIINRLPPFVDAVGVFVNEDPDHLNDMAQYCGLTLAQLHGSEPADYCKTVSCRIIKAFRVKDESIDIFDPFKDLVKGFLLDTYKKGVAGGTGETFDWQLIEKMDIPGPVILSGGLSPENIGEAIRQVRPFAVDVNSGVENGPGRKSIEKIKQLIVEVNKADQSE